MDWLIIHMKIMKGTKMNTRKIIFILILFLTIISCFEDKQSSEEKTIDVQTEEEVLKKIVEEEDKKDKAMDNEKYSECSKLYNGYVVSYEKASEKATEEFYNKKFSPKEKKNILEGRKELTEEEALELSKAIETSAREAGISGEKIDEFYERCEGYQAN